MGGDLKAWSSGPGLSTPDSPKDQPALDKLPRISDIVNIWAQQSHLSILTPRAGIAPTDMEANRYQICGYTTGRCTYRFFRNPYGQ